jgi:NADH:ubiquinone oxidoreductase subunit 4 (subunit M)
MYLLIGIFGTRIEKVKAAHYFFIYTILGSIFMLLGIIQFYQNFNTFNYSDLFLICLDSEFQKII